MGTMMRAATGRPTIGRGRRWPVAQQQDGRQVGAEFRLFGIRMHGGAAQGTPHLSLGSGRRALRLRRCRPERFPDAVFGSAT